MNPESVRSLPTLQLPAAFITFWPAAGQDDPETRKTAAAYASQTGMTRLDERLFAIIPDSGRENVFDDAVTLGQAILGHLRKIGADDEIGGLLTFPGEVLVETLPGPRAVDGTEAVRVRAVEEDLFEDLCQRPPRLKAQGLYFTGYAASWLRGRFQFDSIGLYDGPSGRRVPIHRLVGEAPRLGPWHNPEILSRQVKVARPALRAAFEQAATDVLRIQGPLGSGKSHAVWHYLLDQEGPKLWFRVGRSLFGTATLTRGLVMELHKLAPESLPPGGDALRHPEQLPPVRAAELVSAWLDSACQQLGATLWIVCDLIQSAATADLDLLANLLARRGSIFRLLLISRSGGPVISQLADLPIVEVPPMNEVELKDLGQQIFAGLSMDGEVEKRFLEASAGYPFALEEGLTDLVHHNLIRRVYGSFFYSGGSDVEYQPSRRLVRYVAAEARRLGEDLPLRVLAAADQAVPASRLEQACASFGHPLPSGWSHAFVAAGWLRETPSAWGPGLTFTCPAYGRCLSETVAEESAESLRQALGQALVSGTSPEEITWQTYQLMAGSADALPSLLQLSKQADTPTARVEIFEALEKEYQLHRSRGGAAATEFELLWKLLPLGHRLGKLTELEEGLERAIELAVGDLERYAALALVKAEHDQDQGRHAEAVKGVQAALMASEGSPDQRRALILIQLGKILLRQEKIPEARQLFRQMLALVNRDSPTVLGATCRFHLGEIALRERDLEGALRQHEKALQIRREHGQIRPISASLSLLGDVALARGDFPAALKLFREARDILGDEIESELADAFVGMGRALGHLGDSAAATHYLRRAVEIREPRGNVTAEQVARCYLARNLLDLGQLDPALEQARRAYMRLYVLPSSSHFADASLLMGQVLFQTKQLKEAQDHFEDAKRILNRCQLPSREAIATSWLLRLGLEQGDQSTVQRYATELDALFTSLENPIRKELVLYRLFLAFVWLRERGAPAREPVEYLRRAHRELMRKLGFLEPKMRHQFLFNVRDHEELLNVAVEYDLSLPSFSVQGPP